MVELLVQSKVRAYIKKKGLNTGGDPPQVKMDGGPIQAPGAKPAPVIGLHTPPVSPDLTASAIDPMGGKAGQPTGVAAPSAAMGGKA